MKKAKGDRLENSVCRRFWVLVVTYSKIHIAPELWVAPGSWSRFVGNIILMLLCLEVWRPGGVGCRLCCLRSLVEHPIDGRREGGDECWEEKLVYGERPGC